MKKFLSAFFFLALVVLCGCEDTNMQIATEAGIEAIKAATLSDEQVRSYAARAARHSDGKHRLAVPDSAESRRLSRLLGKSVSNDDYDIRVYLKPEINAFAMADGSIRIYSGLMNILTDEELLFVIGHEMGHVVHEHSRKKLMLAYAASAVRKGLASQEGTGGDIARSAFGGFTELLLNAQFSQQEEQESDDYGLAFLKSQGYTGEAAISALGKLAASGSGHSFFSSHPAPQKRALRLRDRLDGKGVDKKGLNFALVWGWLKKQLALLYGLILSLFA